MTAAAREVFGTDALGVYLYGSVVSPGGLRPHSDLDFFVVLGRPTAPAERRLLVERLSPISARRLRPEGWRPVELTAVVGSEVRPWRYPPRMEFQFGEWLREDYDRGESGPEPAPAPDLAVLITMVLEAGLPLVGPPPARLLDPVAPQDLARAALAGVDDLLADLESDTTNVILTLARILATLETGAIHSKDEAAELVAVGLPDEDRAVLTQARAIYLGEQVEDWHDLRPRAHAARLVRAIRRAR
ncbi:MAG TPA: aminoglycoside adenylyltransferase domain-containing protein [Candidatus Limnocylindrales bacterium]|nr:aminoglycoside adenylyltransferase domain-containing protein [Candidatus Limnocylindrales bacterium]